MDELPGEEERISNEFGHFIGETVPLQKATFKVIQGKKTNEVDIAQLEAKTTSFKDDAYKVLWRFVPREEKAEEIACIKDPTGTNKMRRRIVRHRPYKGGSCFVEVETILGHGKFGGRDKVVSDSTRLVLRKAEVSLGSD